MAMRQVSAVSAIGLMGSLVNRSGMVGILHNLRLENQPLLPALALTASGYPGPLGYR
jgi:hypothetical protein